MSTPSLRNFAVLRRVAGSWQGQVFEVQDRRLAASPQLLFVPNRFKSWPRYLKIFVDREATPVRLRNAKVAVLFGQEVHLAQLKTSLRAKDKGQWTFAALTGFQVSAKRKFPRFILPAACGLVAITLATVLSGPRTLADAKTPHRTELVSKAICVEPLRVGDRVRLNAKKQTLVIQSVILKVIRVQIISGYMQAQIVSKCNSKELLVKAWMHGKTYQIDSVS
jgi:hypothetical protein